MVKKWRALLLGGSTAAGKSTTGAMVAKELGVACLSADSVWKALMAATTVETHPSFHHFEPPPEVMAKGPEHLAGLHIAAAEGMTSALEAFIDWELHEKNRFVFQGAWITPELAARKCAKSEDVRAVFVIEPEEKEILAAMLERSGRTEPLPRQLSISAMADRYGRWLEEETQRLGLPTVEARPRGTLVERIIEAAEGRRA
jgi:2-phosphoglycerate kinase